MRKICVVTGTRAEYGLLYWLMKEIQNDADLTLQILATGAHLSPEFGLTYKIIESDGFEINEKVEMLLSSDTAIGIAKSMGLCLISTAEALDRLQPDIIVLLGDRFETMAVAQAAMVLKIPIAHIAGGEATEGLIDEAIRHSITKMSHLHFVATKNYEKRVIQLGEQPSNVFNFGATFIDNIKRLKLLNKKELEKSLDFKLGEKNFLVTYHPVTLGEGKSITYFNNLLKALDYFCDAKIIFTKPNADADGRDIIHLIDKYIERNKNRAISFVSLGQVRYLSSLKYVDVVIGNSSSGIIEVPSFKKATVNIGIRQKGRIRAHSIIDCEDDATSIKNAISVALSTEFQKKLISMKNPYGDEVVAFKIKEVLKKVNLNQIVIKHFYDL